MAAHLRIAMSSLRPLFLRRYLLQAPSRRRFHASPRPQFLGATLTATHTLFTTLHTASGLPWAALIPLTAILLRLSITTPLTLYSRRRALRTLSLQPLISAWQHPLARAAKQSSNSPQEWERSTRKAVRAKRKEIWKRHGCQMWKTLAAPAMQLPVWIMVSVTLRGMTGTGWLPGWWQRVYGSTTTAEAAAGEILGENLPEEVLEVAKERIVPLEASLADEGALWFPNLLEEDPMMILPVTFTFLLCANIGVSHLLTAAALYRLQQSLFLTTFSTVDASTPSTSLSPYPAYRYKCLDHCLASCISVNYFPAFSNISYFPLHYIRLISH